MPIFPGSSSSEHGSPRKSVQFTNVQNADTIVAGGDKMNGTADINVTLASHGVQTVKMTLYKLDILRQRRGPPSALLAWPEEKPKETMYFYTKKGVFDYFAKISSIDDKSLIRLLTQGDSPYRYENTINEGTCLVNYTITTVEYDVVQGSAKSNNASGGMSIQVLEKRWLKIKNDNP